jgi:hypothetical protein
MNREALHWLRKPQIKNFSLFNPKSFHAKHNSSSTLRSFLQSDDTNTGKLKREKEKRKKKKEQQEATGTNYVMTNRNQTANQFSPLSTLKSLSQKMKNEDLSKEKK